MANYRKKVTTIIGENGKKMYPVGKWEKYSHVFYNHCDKCFNNMMETHTDESEKKLDEAEHLQECLNTIKELMVLCMLIMKIIKRCETLLKRMFLDIMEKFKIRVDKFNPIVYN